MDLVITGAVAEVIDKRSNDFPTMEIWLRETEGQYPQTFNIQVTGKLFEQTEKLKTGDAVTIKTNVRGRLWEKDGKRGCINTIQAWSISKHKEQAQAVAEPSYDVNSDLKDDLPF